MEARDLMTDDQSHILIVDDDRELCELLTLRLGAKGFAVTAEQAVGPALERVGRERFDVVLLDLRLGQDDGFDVLDGMRKRAPDVPVVVLTAHGTIDTAVEAMRRGAFGFATKPFHDHDLLQKIAHAVESHLLRREVAGLRRIVGGGGDPSSVVGASAAIERLRTRLSRVGATDATVLILGESGAGKEIVAREIHRISARSKGPFVAVNYAALMPEQLESTLFGHSRGAFTGAVTEREGLLAAARRGTLFLDEVGEMPPIVQAKLLRVLEDRRYTKVGATTEEIADVRLLAATNRDLRVEVAERRFREDLYHRLHVVPLTVPPLRERRDDVPILAELFLERAAARHGVAPPRISARALLALREHDWPGNVRELANVIEAAVILSRSGAIDPEHLPGLELAGHARLHAVVDDFTHAAEQLFEPFVSGRASPPPIREVRETIERGYLEAVLRRASGNVTLAARIAGRNRTDFYDLLRRYDLTPAAFKKPA